MFIVDSNTWADYFNGVDQPHIARLSEALDEGEDLAVIPMIVTEVLQGFRTDSGFRQARDVLLPLAIQPTLECHVRSAQLFRRLRKTGITVRGAVDCVIAQTCIDIDATLLSPDVDFEHIARHAPLRLWREATP
jgi:predicted nucleic acid-binding protein